MVQTRTLEARRQRVAENFLAEELDGLIAQALPHEVQERPALLAKKTASRDRVRGNLASLFLGPRRLVAHRHAIREQGISATHELMRTRQRIQRHHGVSGPQAKLHANPRRFRVAKLLAFLVDAQLLAALETHIHRAPLAAAVIVVERRHGRLAAAHRGEATRAGKLIDLANVTEQHRAEIVQGDIEARNVGVEVAGLHLDPVPIQNPLAPGTRQRDTPRVTVATATNTAHAVAFGIVDVRGELVELPELGAKLRRVGARVMAEKPINDGARGLSAHLPFLGGENQRAVINGEMEGYRGV